MPHTGSRSGSRSRRYAGRALVLSVLGWALFSRDRADGVQKAASSVLDHDVDCEVPVPTMREPAASTATKARRRRPRRRLATSLAFATLFFAGAALSAGAGDMIAEAVESTTSTEETTTGAEEPAPPEETVPAEEPVAEEPSAEPDDATPPSEGEGGSGGESGGEETPVDPAEEPSDPEPGDGEGPDEDPAGAPSEEPSAGEDSEGDDGEPQEEPEGQPLINPDESPVSGPTPPDPEIAQAGGGATIWLHRSMPDPTPAARRLTPAFARALKQATSRENADWALVLGVLRADGRVDGDPAGRKQLRRLADKLVELGARRDEWSAALALRGRTVFADRAVAAARFHRAVGLRALVTGLERAKPTLERATLADRRISLYAGGRSDIAAHRIDIRVLVTLRYLAEAFGQVTVSSLQSGHRLYSRPGVVSAHVYGLAVDIAGLGGLSIVGNQAPGSITEQAVRAILLLPSGLQARQVISLIGMGGASFAMADHHDHIHVGF